MTLKLRLIVIILITINVLAKGQAKTGETFDGPLSAFDDFPQRAIYQNKTFSPHIRAMDVVRQLTFDEALSLISGYDKFYFPGVPRLGLRPVFMADASQGIRLATNTHGFTKDDFTTSFPGTEALASTWNPELAKQMGKAIGQECRGYGVDILLGPGLNLQRFSVSGRNYEYMGEDPFLASRMAVSYVKGLQSQKVLSTGKHFIGNDQEFCRHVASSDIDERTLREIYLAPWKAVVQEAGIKAVMTGNNAINGVPNALDKQVVNDILRDEYGFTGIAMTDWQNTNYFLTQQYLFPLAGVSLLMPDNSTFKDYVKNYLMEYPYKKEEIRQAINKKVYNNLLPLFEMGVYDRQAKTKSMLDDINSHKDVALKIAEEAICLLKNESEILPLSKKKKILLMGDTELHSGTGSGLVKGYDHVSFADGLSMVYGKNFEEAENPDEEQIKEADAIIYRLNKEGGEGYDVPFEVGLDENIARVAELNPNVIVVISSCNSLPMPWLNKVKAVLWTYYLGQERGNALARVVNGEVNPSGKLPFTLEKSFEDSQNPEFNYIGGKPFWKGGNTDYREYWKYGKKEATTPQFSDNIKPQQLVHNRYTEGIFMGYRWYDKMNKDVVFPFGHGLSYTQFGYSDIVLSNDTMSKNDSLIVSLKISNLGKNDGAETVQLYISDPQCSIERPVKELKHFQKVFLKTGESKVINFVLYTEDLVFWDVSTHFWKAEAGEFTVQIGSSSRDICLKESFKYE